MRGFHIVATDGGIGHVDDFLVEEGDVGGPLPGRRYQQLDRRQVAC